MIQVLDITTVSEFRKWLAVNGTTAGECWIAVLSGRPEDEQRLWYLNAVEVALCYGWIDSTTNKVDGQQVRRFSPRRKNSPWTELNKERVRRLERLGLMTDAGRAVLPDMRFRIDPDFVASLKKARVWSRFKQQPPLYQRVKAYNVVFYRRFGEEVYQQKLQRFIANLRQGKISDDWHDYGRLL